MFGGGGYAIDPGVDNRNYWTGGIDLTRQFGERLFLCIEADRQGSDVLVGHATTSLGLGAIYDLPGPFRLLASGGPTFEDRGVRRRAICAIGRQDAPPEGLVPIDPRAAVLGASSDHLIVDVEDLPSAPKVGDTLRFVPNYSATLRLFTSPYVDKIFRVKS